MFCPKCGSQIENGAKFCENCGEQLDDSPARNANPFAKAAYTSNSPVTLEYSDRNPHIAGLLSLFFGPLGLHDFYCGRTQNGVMKLIFSLVGILAPISFFWNMMDMYSIGDGTFTDGDGCDLDSAPWCKFLVIFYIIGVICLMIGIFVALS